jgi:hypothetical protein
MQQVTSKARTLPRPSKISMFFHVIKTLNLVRSLLIDMRVSIVKKIIFVVPVIGLVLLLIFPDVVNEAFLSTILPIIGTVLGVPIDVGFDWIALGLVALNLLRIFPDEIVAEHYQHIFHRRKDER